MFTRSIVIQRRVEDLQLGVESYQKKLNLTNPDTFCSDLKHKEDYTSYSSPRGFIYQNKDKQNRLVWIDELHKFSDATLNDVRTALDDRLKDSCVRKIHTLAGNPVKEILLKLNLPDHSDEVLKLKNFKKDTSKSSQVIKSRKAFNRRKFYSKPTNNNLRTSSSYQSANKKQVFVKIDTKKVEKKDDEKKRDMSRVKCYNCKKEGHFAKDCKKVKIKDYEYYKTKMLLAKKDKDEQVLLAKDQAWMESSKASSSSTDEKIFEVSYYLSKSESEFKTSEYYDNSTNYGLFVNNDDDQEIFHNAIDSASENFIENHIDSQKDYDKSDVDHNDSEEKDQLVDNDSDQKINANMVFMAQIKKVLSDSEASSLSADEKISKQTSSLKPYVPNVILQNIIIDLEDEVVNLLEKEKVNLETIESLKSKSFESSEKVSSESENQSENDCLVIEKECDKEENPNVIAPGMFKLNVSQISPVSKIPFRKKPSDSMHVRSKSNMINYLPRTMRKWLLKLFPLAEPVAKWFPRIVYICLWIIDSGCSKHMTGNRALLMNFVEKFLGTVRFGNNDFVVIAGYGDVVIGSMTIKKFYYFKGLGHNLFIAGQFCDKDLEVAFRKSTFFV
nr:integrase, catalytic region, zinc finger, CCHC-type, peptidase aspartic, catalytic [Tanacetum cinerariifolium]